MKKVFVAVLLILAALPSLSGFASELDWYKSEQITSDIGIQGWFSTADAKWQTSFPAAVSGQTGRGESELLFKRLKSPVVIYSAGGRISQRFSFDLFYGTASTSSGRGTDTDRFFPDTGGGGVFLQSTSSIHGDVRMWGGDVFFNTNRRFDKEKHDTWGMVLGFLHYEDNLAMTGGVQTVGPPLGPFSGLDSTYDFSWNALRIGVTRQAALAERLSYSVVLSVFPFADFRGEGFWNLRTAAADPSNPSAFRNQSPNFVQTATGYGYDAVLGLTYELSEDVEVSAGYRFFYLYARDGTDTVYFADGTSADSTLDWATVTRQGATAQLLFKF